MTDAEFRTIVESCLPEAIRRQNGQLLYSGIETLSPGDFYFVGFNPAKDGTNPCLDNAPLHMHDWSAYTKQCWECADCPPDCPHIGKPFHQKNVKNIMSELGLQCVRDCYINSRYSMLKFDEYVLDSLMRDLVGHDRKPASYLVYMWLAAEQQRQKKPVTISYSDLAESVGVSKSSAQSAVAWLIHRKLITSTKANVTATPNYTVQTPWKGR